jgi:4-diphosphocytidyl-2-C-methyl-D-erythritol kinase
MAAVSLADEIILAGAEEDRITFDCPWPVDEGFLDQNLVMRAIKGFRAVTGQPGFLSAHVIKNIPLGAGLGGGSSDAAAVLKHLNKNGVLSPAELQALALDLGSDVPFGLGPPLAVARGRGQTISPWSGPLPPPYAVLINPGCHLSTGLVFRKLGLTKEFWRNNLSPDLDRNVPEIGQNDLLAPALALCPGLKEVMAAAASLGGEAYGLSGSGPTFWILFGREQKALTALEEVRGLNTGWWITFSRLILAN